MKDLYISYQEKQSYCHDGLLTHTKTTLITCTYDLITN